VGTGNGLDGLTTDENPLRSDSAAVWDRLIEAVGPASLLVIINDRMSATLRKRLTPEDIWQETLLHAWRDRSQFDWRGLKSFRSWLLTIIDHRIRDAAAHEEAQKRGGGESPVAFSVLEPSGTESKQGHFAGPVVSTTPSRVAMYREQAGAMQAALNALPPELRDVVRLRLFEQLTMEEVANRLGIGVSGARHRFRKGVRIYQRRLLAELTTRSQVIPEENATDEASDSSPKQ
jgi:RNA polymerase sigma-70 factor (ECF subfamily)